MGHPPLIQRWSNTVGYAIFLIKRVRKNIRLKIVAKTLTKFKSKSEQIFLKILEVKNSSAQKSDYYNHHFCMITSFTRSPTARRLEAWVQSMSSKVARNHTHIEIKSIRHKIDPRNHYLLPLSRKIIINVNKFPPSW